MIEIQKGIYQVKKGTKKSNSSPLILVHPWFSAFGMSFDSVIRQEREEYLANLEKLLTDKGEIFLFEEFNRLNIAEKRMLEIKNEYSIFLVPTHIKSPVPHPAKWEEVAKFLKEFNEYFRFAGGVLIKNSEGHHSHFGKYSGCLGETYSELGRNKINGEFVKGCCFTSSVPPRVHYIYRETIKISS